MESNSSCEAKLKRSGSAGLLARLGTKKDSLPRSSSVKDLLKRSNSVKDLLKRASSTSKIASPPPAYPQKSDTKKSFSGIISKIVKQNRTTKLWSSETAETKKSFEKKPKYVKSNSLPGDMKPFPEFRSTSADLGYESSDHINCETCSQCSSEDDECNRKQDCRRYFQPELKKFRRSFSAPGMTQGSAESRQKMATRHWQWYLRSSSSTWESFNTDKVYCY